MRDTEGGEFIDIPEGWSKTVFFSRVVKAGLCHYESLVLPPSKGGLNIQDIFEMHRMLDWNDYCEMLMAERRKNAN